MNKEEITLKDGTVLKRKKLYTIETTSGNVYQCRICSIDEDFINITTIKSKTREQSSLIIYIAGIKSAEELHLNAQ